MDTRSNGPTLDALRHLSVCEVIALAAEHRALVQSDAREALDAAKRTLDWIEGAIALRYEQRAVGARAAPGKDTGIVRFEDGTVEVAVGLPKQVEWDQRRLAALVEQIRAGGEDPGEYVELSFKISERAYAARPERIRGAFEPARILRTGKPGNRLTILNDVALRDSPHGAGLTPAVGGTR